jgi:hypothetical protein
VAAAQGVKARLLVNIALVAALLALALYAYFRPQPKAATGMPVTTLARDAVVRIRVEPRGAPPIELEKSAAGWAMTAPYRTRVDALHTDRLLDIVAATAKQKLPRSDLARFDLTAPRVRVTLNDQRFDFGAVNELTNEQYLATADGVYLVPPYLGYGISTDPAKLISRHLLATDEAPVSFQFGGWSAAKDDNGKWLLHGKLPSAQPLSQDDLNRWADEWKATSSLETAPYRGRPGREQVTLTTREGKRITFQILSREAQTRLVRSDERMEYRLGAEAGRRLLDPWSVAAKS